ncbi:hypothetical protein OPKNFCMD_1388 [Methylobacterium crusticola]|uniref:SsuA/THI5-like domain-containing protein n=1 Tax=Methylobacterium crusticola TaxID=1697972 RepID=A0ABQ4QUS1_9HYPH|nr:ABC transporter substrate-binding protein [Methylobacterium crusticola]GJD48665.1 hypothetical protein OPKNFCMD_1388 [Methylobacterium crusticola]
MSLIRTSRMVAAAALASSLLAGQALAQTKLVAGIAAYNEALLPIHTAEQKGYLKEAGLTLELVTFKGGGPAVQALVGGSIDLCLCAADHVVRLRSRRQPARILVGLDGFHSYALLAKGDAPYVDLAGLKGRRIGVTSPGSLTDNTLQWAIRKAGLRPDRDFEIIGAGSGAAMQAAIDSGQVAAGLLITTDAVAMLRKAGAYRVVVDYRTMPYPSFDAIALESWIGSHRPAAQGFVRAVSRAIADLRADPALAAAVTRTMYPDFPADLVQEVARSAVSRMPEGGTVSSESIATMNAILLAADDSLKPVTLQDVYDASLSDR